MATNNSADTRADEDKQEAPLPPGTAVSERASSHGALAVMDFGDDAGLGIDGAGADEFVIPFLTVLQTNSPQCDDIEGVPGAKPGMLFNTATGELYDGRAGVVFLPVHRDHNFAEFVPRNLGGGFVGTHAPDDDLVLALRAKYGKFGRLYTSEKRTSDGMPAEGTEIQETFSLYGLLVDEATGLVQRVIVPFKSTQIRKYKAFVSRADGIRYQGTDGKPVKPPLWAHRWRITTVGESNKKGKFYGFALRLAGQAADGTELPIINSLVKRTDPLYASGREFYDLVVEGRVKADYAGAARTEGDGGEEDIPM